MGAAKGPRDILLAYQGRGQVVVRVVDDQDDEGRREGVR